jgi:hypothetical protein
VLIGDKCKYCSIVTQYSSVHGAVKQFAILVAADFSHSGQKGIAITGGICSSRSWDPAERAANTEPCAGTPSGPRLVAGGACRAGGGFSRGVKR